MQKAVGMQILRECALSFLSKPTIDYRFIDSAGFVTEVLRSCGVIADSENSQSNYNAQELFDKFHITGSWNRFSLGALAFYGRSVTEVGHVGILLDPYTVISAYRSEDGIGVAIRPIHFRNGLVAVIKPSYASLGCP